MHERNIAIEADNVTKWLSEAPDAGKAIKDILMDLAEEIYHSSHSPGVLPWVVDGAIERLKKEPVKA